jgi:two-component system cell cycle sensor histidine kinase/response regulator CckA
MGSMTAPITPVDAQRFLSRVTRWIVAAFGTLAMVFVIALVIAPQLSAPWRRALSPFLNYGLLAAIIGIMVLVAVLHRGIGRVIRGLTSQHDTLASKNRDLEAQADANRALTDELRHTTRRLSVAQHVAQLGYWEIDPATGMVYWSEEMYHLADLDPSIKPPPTDRFLQRIHIEDRIHMEDVAAAAIANQAEFSEQYRIVRPNGKVRTVQAHGRVIDDGDGRRMIGTVQDITDRTQLETQLRQSQKMEAVGQLAGGIAHDFNNLLTVIEGYSSLLLSTPPDEPTDTTAVIEIRDAARRAAALTRQLLVFSRQQVQTPRAINLNDALRGVESMLRRLIGEHIDFRTVLDPAVGLVRADPGQIELVLMNLAVNARDAMEDGGRLTIETANVVLDAHHAQRHPIKKPGPHVMLAVSDTGTGIPPGVLDHIFEPFFTTKAVGSGTGIGLATVHSIVHQADGHIWVYTEPGRGTTFKVFFPLVAPDETAADTAPAVPVVPPGAETILLVEDDRALRAMTATMLRKAGYTVIEAVDGVQALKVASDLSQHLDLVVSDMVMPAMGGRALTTELNQRRPNVPVLLMSGYTRDTILHTSGASTAGLFIEKPFTPEAMLRKVRDVLDRGVAS